MNKFISGSVFGILITSFGFIIHLKSLEPKKEVLNHQYLKEWCQLNASKKPYFDGNPLDKIYDDYFNQMTFCHRLSLSKN